MMEQFHFLRPEWFYALIPACLLMWFTLKRSRSSQSWKTVCDAQLLPHVLTHAGGRRRHWISWLLFISSVLAITAGAGPVWEKLPQPVFRDQSALVIALDLSQSMDATDIKPSRLSRARLKLLDILKLRKTGQTALLVYAADAFVVAPLTDDTGTIKHLTSTLETGLMPAQGSNTIKAIDKASELLQQAGSTNGHIILISDGIRESQIDQISRALPTGTRLSILGIGTTDGGPIPLASGFLQDRSGAIVIPRLQPELLRKAAAAGGGRYRSMTTDDSDITDLLALLDSEVDMQDDRLDLTADSWREQGPWLLLLVIPLVALYARKGWLLTALIFIVPVPDQAYAIELDALWQTHDQQAMQAFEKGEFENAAEKFENKDWKASALYRQQDYQKVIETLETADDSDSYYNRANAQAKLGQLQQAIEAYDQALALDPDNEDAAYNKKLVEDALQQQQSQQQSDQSSDRQDDRQQDDQQQDQQSSENNQSDSQQQSDQQSDQQDSQQSEQQSSDDAQQNKDSQQDESRSADQEQDNKQDHAEAQQAEKEPSQQQQEAESAAQKQAELSDEDADEQERATELWLQRIPDDPGGLMRRKFLYQYKQRAQPAPSEQPW